MLNVNKVIILENDEEYLVLDKVKYNDNEYYYIARVNSTETDIENDYKLVTVEERDNNKVISEVTGEDKLKEILPLLNSKLDSCKKPTEESLDITASKDDEEYKPLFVFLSYTNISPVKTNFAGAVTFNKSLSRLP